MKKVIFICMLSFSLCFSQVEQPNEKATKGTKPGGRALADLLSSTSTEKAPVQPSTSTVASAVQTTTNASVPTEATIKTTEAAHVTTEANSATTANATETSSSTTSMVAPSTFPTPDHKEEKPTNYTSSTTPVAADTSSTPKPTLQARAFDGPSFIGGMILTLGLLAIGFMGFKYYKNQTERNYHTL